MRVVDLDFVFDSQHTLEYIVEEAKSKILPLLMTLTNHCLHMLVLELLVVTTLSHVAYYLTSTLVSAKVVARYLLTKEKLRKDLKLKKIRNHGESPMALEVFIAYFLRVWYR